MRLIGTFKNVDAAHRLAHALSQQGIENKCEDIVITDWGSAAYGDRLCRVWVVDEDRLQEALSLSQTYPLDESHIEVSQSASTASKTTSTQPNVERFSALRRQLETEQADVPPSTRLGPVTLYIILACAVLFFWNVVESPSQERIPDYIPRSIAFGSPIFRTALYDYPKVYELLDQFVALAQKHEWRSEADIPPEGRALMSEVSHTPFWRGFYAIAVQALRGDSWRPMLDDPRFEKLHEGQIWRLWTPALLHSDLLHIVFNMLWLVVLGRQMELRLGIWRYLLFCLIVGAFSNTLQYLMSGPNFIGFSGILCGMLAYIWIRQKRAPWEGYQLQKGTLLFLSIFILAMLGLQLLSFMDEIYWHQGITTGIANTAHFSGAFAGFVLGRLGFK